MSNLKKGDSVAIISPSATIKDNTEATVLCDKGEKIISELGFKIVHGKNIYGKNFYKSGAVSERLSDIEDAFRNPEVKAIFCTQGGDNANELLSVIDWDVIKNNSKLFFGLSDITVLLNAIYARTKQITYYGLDVMWGLGKNGGEYTKKQLEDFLFSNVINFNSNPEYAKRKIIKPGVSAGLCLGGCLSSFVLLLGTDNDPLKNISEPFIFIMEDIAESFARIEAYVAQLFQQPNFKKYCQGIIIGYFFLCQEENEANNRKVSDIVLDYAGSLDFPIIEIMELGHAVENNIFPIGGLIRITANDSLVHIEYLNGEKF